MEYEERPIAFVAMKFDGSPWKDKKYVIIKDELERSGYRVERADEIRTSGPVVDEVCDKLASSDLVVIDTTGDSHSVSYELGFCHGVARSPEHTLLVREDSEIPFNYQHFRHRIYKDNRELRRVIRSYLDISEPLVDTQYGFIFMFEFSESAKAGYILDGVEAVFDAISQSQLNGRCECYTAERYEIQGRWFSVGLGIRLQKGSSTPEYNEWVELLEGTQKAAKKFSSRITLDENLSELASLRDLRNCLLASGSAEFRSGKMVRSMESGPGNWDFFRDVENRHSGDV